MSNPNPHPLTIKPITLESDRIAEILRIYGTETDAGDGSVLMATIAGSPILAGALNELLVGKWTVPTLTASGQRANGIGWRQFERWCDQHSLVPLPASTTTVLRYLADYATTGVAAGTVRKKAHSISYAHRQEHRDDPTSHEDVKELLEGVERSAARAGIVPSLRLTADFADVRKLIDAVVAGSYWKRYLSRFEPWPRQVVRLLDARWRAAILLEWAGSLAARDSLYAGIDDIKVDRAVGLMLPPSIEHPTGREVRLMTFDDPRYDPVSALADWIELLLPYLPPCRALFPTVRLLRTPTVVCRVCGPEARDRHPRLDPKTLDRALDRAVHSDGTQFTRIAQQAGLPFTRDGLRLGIRTDAEKAGATTEEIRRQLRYASARPAPGFWTPPGPGYQRGRK